MASIDIIDQRLQINALEGAITRSLISGKAIPEGTDRLRVFDLNNVLIEDLSVLGGVRTPSMGRHCFVVTNGIVNLSVSAVMSYDGNNEQQWLLELTQTKEL